MSKRLYHRQGGFRKLEMDTVLAFKLGIMIKAQNECVGRIV